MRRLGFGILGALGVFFGNHSAFGAPAFPSLYFCAEAPEGALLYWKEDVQWVYPLGEPVFDVAARPRGFLLAGGFAKLLFLQKQGEHWHSPWNWEKTGFDAPTCAVVAVEDYDGREALILAGDAARKRLILAEAKSRRPKVRWEYALPAFPHSVQICPDTGFFLTAFGEAERSEQGEEEGFCGVWEIQYHDDLVVRAFGKAQGLFHPLEATRARSGETYIADGKSGNLVAVGAKDQVHWRKFLGGEVRSVKVWGKFLVVLSEKEEKQILWLLNRETAEVLRRLELNFEKSYRLRRLAVEGAS